jgi:hypothetical protein
MVDYLAYKSTKSFKYTSSSISKSSVIDVRPLTFRSFKNCSRSFKYIEKRNGERFSPCRKVNAEKSKVLVLSNGRLPANLKFTYNNRDLEIVQNFSYLGITFSKSGSFNAAKKDLKKSLKTFSWFCISSFDSDIITVSSAYKSTKSFKYTSSSISKSFTFK